MLPKSRLVICVLILVCGCVPTPTPTVTVTPPQSPPITPTVISPVATPKAVTPTALTFRNGGFERPYTTRASAETLAQYWFPYHSDVPPCTPGQPGCTLPCPSNCGTCTKSDLGCWWASPEWAEAWYADYGGFRVRSGQSAQKMFVYARQGDPRVYQQVNVIPGTVLTFSAYLMGWQCFDNNMCTLAQLNTAYLPSGIPNPIYDPVRVQKLLAAWGCDYKTCRSRAISDRPYALNLRVGIDTMGLISPTAPSMVWGTRGESWDMWSKFVVTATAQSSTITLWIESRPMFDYARTNNDITVDDATLVTYFPYKYNYLPLIRK